MDMTEAEAALSSLSLEDDDDAPAEPAERIAKLKRDRWIPYNAANAALDRLRDLYEYPRCHRAPCLLIVGDTNNGKTTIALQFRREISKRIRQKPDQTEVPVLIVQMPGDPDLGTLYSLMLRGLGAPFSESMRKEKKFTQILALLPRTRTRMLIIDEIHNILEAHRDRQRIILNTLKFFSNELGIPIVLIGTREALRVIQTDQQLGNRFEPFSIPRWRFDVEYARFAVRLYGTLGLKGNTKIKSKSFIRRLHAMSEGLAGETKKVLILAAQHAIRSRNETIDMKVLDAIDWTQPSERRKKAERL
jgi:hypothetical protein